jgi:hypothetical protein
MADYYTQFSFALKSLSKKECAWLRELLDTNPDDVVEVKRLSEHIGPEIKNFDVESVFDFWPHFEFEFELEGKERTLYLTSSDFGSPDQVALLVHAYMRHFKKKGVMVLRAAYTCSRSHTDGFGGATGFVTKDGILWMSSIEEMVEKALEGEERQSLEKLDLHVQITRQ